MKEETNKIQLTVIQPSEADAGEIRIDFSAILEGMKRLLAVWLALSVALGALAAGLALAFQNFFYIGDAQALISFSNRSTQPLHYFRGQLRQLCHHQQIPLPRRSDAGHERPGHFYERAGQHP